jgi:glycine betaine/proline transport system ATP-binding protein
MAVIGVENVYKIFGEEPGGAFPLLEQGKTKEEIQAETGLVVGVHDVSFRMESGTLFVIMGLSGSGKSTLLRCINRLIEPTRGSVYLEFDSDRIDVTTLSADELRELRKTKVSMIFQHFALFPYRSVLDNVAFGLEIQGVDKRIRREKSMEILKLVGLEAWAESYPPKLSGGMQQRVGLARALASEAELLLMDEPFSALDPLIRMHMQEELLNLRDRVRRTILFISHDLDEALKLGDRIAIMEAGRIVQLGTPEDIIVNPKTEYVANFVEHADATGVLTVSAVAKKVPVQKDPPAGLDVSVLDPKPSAFAEAEGLVICLNADGKPVSAFIDGNSMAFRYTTEDLSEVGAETVLLASHDITLRELMRARLNTSHNPVIALDHDGKMDGVITGQEILLGVLEKGRKEGEA